MFESFIHDKNYDVICLCEHFLTEDEVTVTGFPGYMVASHFCRSTRRGGVLILTKFSIDFRIVDLTSLAVEEHAEVAGVYLVQHDIYILCVYRIPGGDPDVFLDCIERVIYKVGINNNIVLTGDFNIHFNTNNNLTLRVSDTLSSFNMKQMITSATRMGNCIDNIFINFDKTTKTSAYTVDCCISDHMGLVMELFMTNKSRNINKRLCRPITEKGKFDFHDVLTGVDWQFVSDLSVSAEMAFYRFCHVIQEACLSSFPVKLVIFNTKDKHWFNSSLKTMRETLKFLCLWYRQNPNQDSLRIRNDYKQLYKQAVNQTKRDYHDRLIQSSSNKAKAAWGVVNDIRGRKVSRDRHPIDISAASFNDYFANVAYNIVNDCQLNTDDVYFHVGNVQDCEFAFDEVSYCEVREVILNLKNGDARDIYGLTTTLVKCVREILVYPLTKLINRCIRENIFPKSLKRAIVIPVFKKGDRNEIANYRPISLLPIFSKVFEKCIASRIMNYLESNDLLIDCQYGFRKGMSTASAILNLTNYINEAFEAGDYVSTVFCDLSKAFDCVSHGLLISKLTKYKFSSNAISLIKSYLTDRSQQVVCDQERSHETHVGIGIPQGSVLGPLLFLIFINNLPMYSTSEHFVIFADDTTVSVRSNDFNDLIGRMCEAHSRAKTWFNNNSLKLNDTKTNHVVFSLRPIGHCHLPLKESVQFLGVKLDSGLIWDDHIDQLARKLNSNFFLIRNLSLIVSQDVLLNVYYALCHSLFTYAVVAWGHAPQAARIFGLQRKIVRVIAGLRFRDDCRHVFADLKILTFPCVYILHTLVYVHQNIHYYRLNGDFHQYNTRSKNLLSLPFCRLGRCQDGPRFLGTKLYNKIPDTLKGFSVLQFKSKVRNLLIQGCFYSVDEFLRSNLMNGRNDTL